MMALARMHVWWPEIDGNIEDTVRQCTACQVSRNRDTPVPSSSWPYPTSLWSRIHADFAGPLDGRMFLIITDAHSKWIEIVIMTSTTSDATISVFERLFPSYGLPHALVTDNGTQFTSSQWKRFMECNRIVHMRSAPYYPATNGAAERNVLTFKAALTAKKRGGLSWNSALQQFLHYRATPYSTTGKSPASMFLSREVRTRLDLVNSPASSLHDPVADQPADPHVLIINHKSSPSRKAMPCMLVPITSHMRSGYQEL